VNAENDGLTVSVVPGALTNLWGSFFSRIEQGGAMVRQFRLTQAGPEVLRERALALHRL
jgi:hypothetical protein